MYWLISLLLLPHTLWVLYLAVMCLKRARDVGTLTRVAYILGLPILGIGLLLDFIANTIVLTVLLLELPREWLVTARLSRHIHNDSGWRKKVALWIGVHFLDPYDPSGKHLK